jgi:hypothetical protein
VKTSTTGVWDVPELKVRERHHQRENVNDRPWEVPELKVRERPPSTLRNIDGGPPGGAGARDPGAPTINAKKHRQRAPGRCRS